MQPFPKGGLTPMGKRGQQNQVPGAAPLWLEVLMHQLSEPDDRLTDRTTAQALGARSLAAGGCGLCAFSA